MTHKSIANDQQSTDDKLFDRRSVLTGASAVLATAAVVASSQSHAEEMDHSAHHGMKKHQNVTHAAFHCVMMGQACMEHCLVLFQNGDTSVAACARTVQEMIPMCQTLAQLSALDSQHLAALAKVCIAVCTSCEKECRKHAKTHIDCKNCADSCLACIKECEKIAE